MKVWEVSVSVRKSVTVRFGESDVRSALKLVIPEMPDNAEITITVPSGGDYSGDELRLEECGGLTVSWEEVHKEG